MKKIVMEDIEDVTLLKEDDFLFIEFKPNIKNLDFKFLQPNYYVRIHGDKLYVFNENMELELRVGTEHILRMIAIHEG